MIEEIIDSKHDYQLQVYLWPNNKAKAWVHINHGMAEHAKRYTAFAEQLVAAGYAVVAHNHRGHGTSSTTTLGSFGQGNDWSSVLDDIDVVRDKVCNDGLAYYLFGHSMGSFIVQSYLTTRDRHIDGLILSGSNLQPLGLAKLGRLVAKVECFRLGHNNSSKLLQFLSFGSFNQAFKPNRTEYDWLSREADEVDKYSSDPLCGFACSSGLWFEFLDALINLYQQGNLQNIQANLPIFILGGDKDPVGLMGKGLPKLAQAYQDAGQAQVKLTLYRDGRHEMLNELNRDRVIGDIIAWLNKQN
jgi:alpha-beta hydrolase superfamily lysophospholipase